MKAFLSVDRAVSASLLFVLCLAIPACSSGPEKKQEPAPEEASRMLEVELASIDGADPKARERSADRVATLGKSVCRALGREVNERIESGETGPGLVCLLRLLGALGGELSGEPLKNAALKRTLEPGLRVEAIRSMACSGLPACLEALLECAAEAEPLPVRLAAAAALALFSDEASARDCLKLLLTAGPDPLRAEAARSLLSCGEGALKDVFMPRLFDALASVRLAAIAYFRRFPDPEAAEFMKAISATDPDLRVVSAAGRALQEIE